MNGYLATVKDSLTVQIPEGMTEVSHDVFWRHVRCETRNIHPTPERFHTNWELVGTRHLWGWSSRGWLGPFDWQGAPPERFALARVIPPTTQDTRP